MAEPTAPPEGTTAQAEEAGFYHEAALQASWVGARLAIGGLAFGFGSFLFAYFYLRALNSHDMWRPAGFAGPQLWAGTLVMALVVASALIQTAGLRRIKAGAKGAWLGAASAALLLGLAAIGVQVWQLLNLPFYPGSTGFASVFVGFWPVFVVVIFAVMAWLEMLIMAARPIPQISFVEQPPTYAEAFAVQRFQANLSSFTIVWNCLAGVAIVAWVLFYLVA
jgi:heme/copper-type cytochrome/quinol oxidase subunit 3